MGVGLDCRSSWVRARVSDGLPVTDLKRQSKTKPGYQNMKTATKNRKVEARNMKTAETHNSQAKIKKQLQRIGNITYTKMHTHRQCRRIAVVVAEREHPEARRRILHLHEREDARKGHVVARRWCTRQYHGVVVRAAVRQQKMGAILASRIPHLKP